MANQQLIRGARMAADQFTDVSGAVERAVLRGEQALLRRRAEEQRLQENNARAIAQLPQLDESKVPMQMRGWAAGEAVKLREEAIAAINNPDFGPVEKQMAISNAIGKINGVATQANDFKQWVANVADLQQEDLSKLNSETLYNRINDIYEGNFVVQDGQFVFADGTTKDFNSLVNTRPITRRSDAYESQIKALGAQFEKYALQGWNETEFDSKIDQVLSDEKYTDGDIASIAVDELGLSPDLVKDIQDDFEDNGQLDTVNKQDLVNQIKDQYRSAAKTAYDRAKSLYDRKTAVKQTKGQFTPYQLFQISKERATQQEKQDAYLNRVIPAIRDIDSVNFNDLGNLQATSGLMPVKYTEEEAEDNLGLENTSAIVLGGKYVITPNMTQGEKVRVLLDAMVNAKKIQDTDRQDILDSLIQQEQNKFEEVEGGTERLGMDLPVFED
jgi:hypothetical protein